MLMLVVWGLWSLATLMQGETAPVPFLPPSMERIFQDFGNFIEQSQTLAKDPFETAVDIRKLPANYHNEEKMQRKLGNATMYSHHEINKMTDNRTGDMMFSEKTVSSIEVADAEPAEEEKQSADSEEEISPEANKPPTSFRFVNASFPEPKPRLAFLIFRLPQHPKREQVPEPNWAKDEPLSDRKHRLLAIRNGLLAAPHPIKKMVLLATPNHRLMPRKHHFSFLWRKI